MSYYRLLGLEKEPFSTSPDPEFFYESQEHRAALMRLLVEIRLKRGLSLILGDVGVGKTTLSRRLLQMLKEREDIIFHLILDPTYDNEHIFLESLVRTFKIETAKSSPTTLDYKEILKDYLFMKGVQENKTVVLVVDECQKLNQASLEVLRVLLNYETNEYKLLQLVLLSQLEVLPKLNQMPNLWDRISLKYMLNPLDERETKEMINYRLKVAGFNSRGSLFTNDAIAEIHRYTKGYPRRISMLCHNALKALIMSNRVSVDARVIWDIINNDVKLTAAAVNI